MAGYGFTTLLSHPKFDSMYGVVHHFYRLYYLQLHVDYLPLHQVRFLVLRGTSQHSHRFSASTVKVSALRPPKVAPHSPGMAKSSVKTYLRHLDGQSIDIVYVGTWIGNGVVYGPIYGNM